MSSTILQNPYTAILQAIWSIIKEVAQVAGNNLGKVRTYQTRLNYEYTTDSGAGNPLGILLHPEEWGCGMSKRKPPKTAKEQTYWQAVRLLVLKRDGNQCQSCGLLNNLCVHHLSYAHQGNELEHLEDLITLCRSCHAKVHEGWKPDKSKSLPKRKFNPDGVWRVDRGGGKYADLDECIEYLFENARQINGFATTKQVKNRCLEVGYVSIGGWTICYITDDGESTLDVEAR